MKTNALHCEDITHNTMFIIIICFYYTHLIFPVERETHGFIEIAKLPGDLKFAVVLHSHLTVQYSNVNMHTS